MAATGTAKATQRKPAPANGATTAAVEALLAELDQPLDPARSVHAALARKLAATLDGMGPAVAAKMSGQTAGALLRTLDKLGAPRGDGIVSTSGRRTPPVTDSTATAPTPNTGHGPGQLSRDGVTLLADAPLTDAYWYDGFEDNLAACHMEWVILQNARRRGLPRPGTLAYGERPWAVDAWEWVRVQRERRETKPFRPLALMEGRGDVEDGAGPLPPKPLVLIAGAKRPA